MARVTPDDKGDPSRDDRPKTSTPISKFQVFNANEFFGNPYAKFAMQLRMLDGTIASNSSESNGVTMAKKKKITFIITSSIMIY